MDAEVLANLEGYRQLVAMRDQALTRAEQEAVLVRNKIAALARGNRVDRRKAAAAEAKLAAFEMRARTQIDCLFERLTRGFEPSAGTSVRVQIEASAALDEIFSR